MSAPLDTRAMGIALAASINRRAAAIRSERRGMSYAQSINVAISEMANEGEK
jgi:hypothetical protein